VSWPTGSLLLPSFLVPAPPHSRSWNPCKPRQSRPATPMPASPASVQSLCMAGTHPTSCPLLQLVPLPSGFLQRGCPWLPVRALRDSRCGYAGWCRYRQAWPRRGSARRSPAWHDMALSGMAWPSVDQHSMAWLGMTSPPQHQEEPLRCHPSGTGAEHGDPNGCHQPWSSSLQDLASSSSPRLHRVPAF